MVNEVKLLIYFFIWGLLVIVPGISLYVVDFFVVMVLLLDISPGTSEPRHVRLVAWPCRFVFSAVPYSGAAQLPHGNCTVGGCRILLYFMAACIILGSSPRLVTVRVERHPLLTPCVCFERCAHAACAKQDFVSTSAFVHGSGAWFL